MSILEADREGNMVEEDKTTANARIGYQMAVSLMIHESQTLWSRCGSMLVANSIILAFIGLSMTTDTFTVILPMHISNLMAVLGIILCIQWFSLRTCS